MGGLKECGERERRTMERLGRNGDVHVARSCRDEESCSSHTVLKPSVKSLLGSLWLLFIAIAPLCASCNYLERQVIMIYYCSYLTGEDLKLRESAGLASKLQAEPGLQPKCNFLSTGRFSVSGQTKRLMICKPVVFILSEATGS